MATLNPRPNQPHALPQAIALISAFLIVVTGCVSNRPVQSDFYFLPSAAKASVSFEGETQAGRGLHRLEVRRMTYVAPGTQESQTAMGSCVIYYAGDEYGPHILRVLDDCIDPLVRRVSSDVVEVYFLAGAHTHIRQQWRLLGYTARLETEEEISWRGNLTTGKPTGYRQGKDCASVDN